MFRFCAAWKWPDPDTPHTDPTATAGITWHELAVAFIVNTGLQFPTWLRTDTDARARPFHWQDPKVLALPILERSLREQAAAFRTIVLYLQGYADGPLLPVYSKTGSSSLTQTGWGRAYTGGFALRPELPNSGAIQRTLIPYVERLHCKPCITQTGWFLCNLLDPIFLPRTLILWPLTSGFCIVVIYVRPGANMVI